MLMFTPWPFFPYTWRTITMLAHLDLPCKGQDTQPSKSIRAVLALLLLALLTGQAPAAAQTVTLHDGQAFKGTYHGGTPEIILLAVDGDTMTFPIAEVRSLTFDPPPPPPVATREAVTVPAGTRLMVRTGAPLVTGKTKSGDRFQVALEGDLIVNGQVVAARGTTVYGRVVEAKAARRVAGRAKLVLELTDLSMDGRLIPLVSNRLELEGDRSGTLKKTAGGAAIGGLVEGNDGLITGGAVGAGVSLLTPGKQIQIPAGTLIEFRTQQPLTRGSMP